MKTIQLIIIAFLFLGCSKQEIEAQPDLTRAEILSSTGWILLDWTVTGMTLDGNRFAFDQYDQLETCSKQDIMYFNTNGSFTQIRQCDIQLDPIQVMNGTWELNSDESMMYLVTSTIGEVQVTFKHFDSFQIIYTYYTIHHIYGRIEHRQRYKPVPQHL